MGKERGVVVLFVCGSGVLARAKDRGRSKDRARKLACSWVSAHVV